jgi:malate synthase
MVTRELVDQLIEEELAAVRREAGEEFDAPGYATAAALFRQVALADAYQEFLTLPAYESMA